MFKILGLILTLAANSAWAGWSFTYTPAGPGAGSCSPPVVTVPQCTDFGGGGSCEGFATLSPCEAARAQIQATQKTCGNGKLNTYAASPCTGFDSDSGSSSASLVLIQPYGQTELNNEAQGAAFFTKTSPYSSFRDWVIESQMRWDDYLEGKGRKNLVIPSSEFSYGKWFKQSAQRWKWYLKHGRDQTLKLPSAKFHAASAKKQRRQRWKKDSKGDSFQAFLKTQGEEMSPEEMAAQMLAAWLAPSEKDLSLKNASAPIAPLLKKAKLLKTKAAIAQEEKFEEEYGIKRSKLDYERAPVKNTLDGKSSSDPDPGFQWQKIKKAGQTVKKAWKNRKKVFQYIDGEIKKLGSPAP